MEERRTYRRFPAQFNVTLRRTAESSESIEAKSANLSSVGLRAVVHEQMEVGEKFVVEVVDTSLAGDQLVIGEGEVVRVESPQGSTTEPFIIGIRFINPDEPTIQRLLKTIQLRNLAEARQRSRNQRDQKKKRSFGF
jgi:hypothetical protein